MFTSSLERKFLLSLYKRYNTNFGYGLRNLQKCPFYILGTASFETEFPEVWKFTDGTKHSQLMDWAEELKEKGWVSLDKTSLTFYLTEVGYLEANKSYFGRMMSYLNNNPGLALPVAIFSLIVAIIALAVDA